VLHGSRPSRGCETKNARILCLNCGEAQYLVPAGTDIHHCSRTYFAFFHQFSFAGNDFLSIPQETTTNIAVIT
jgi:hypothetical protein